MESTSSCLKKYCWSKYAAIHNFEWNKETTWGSSLKFLLSVGLCRVDPSSQRIACKKKECHSVGLHPDIAPSVISGGIGNNVPGLSTNDSGRI